MIKKIFLVISILFFINLFFIDNISFDSSISHPQTNLSCSLEYQDTHNTSSTSSRFTQKILGVKTAKAEETEKKHMIMQGLEDGGSGTTWVFDIWKLCMSLVNIVLVGILIFLGVVNILHLNYDTYELKKFLVPLIVSIILANFSLFICRAVVELSSALSETFLKNQAEISTNIAQGLGFRQAGTIMDQVNIIGGGELGKAASGIAMFIAQLFIGLIIAVVLIILFLAITLLLYVRVFVILVLAAISPLAFVAMVIPATQQYFKQWWSWFLRWVFMGPIIVLILKVAAIIGGQTVSSTSGAAILTVLVSFIAIIGLLVLAVLTPFIIGGSVMGKITDFAKKSAGFVGDNTHFGRGVKGIGNSFIERRASKLKSTEQQYKEGTTAGYDTLKAGGSFGQAWKDAGEAHSSAKSDFELEQLKPHFESQEKFDNFVKSNKFKNKNAGTQIAIMKHGAQKGFVGKDHIDDLAGSLKKDKMNQGTMESAIDNIITINNRVRMEKGLTPEKLSNSAIDNTADRENHDAKRDLENNLKSVHNIRNAGARRKILKQSLKDIDTLNSSTGSDAVNDHKEAKKQFINAKETIDSDPTLKSQFQDDEMYKKLNKNSSLNSSSIHLNEIPAFVDAKAAGLKKTVETHERASLKETLSRKLDINKDTDLRKLLHAKKAYEKADYKINSGDFDTFINDYQISTRSPLSSEDKKNFRDNIGQLEQVDSMSDDEIKRILGIT